MKAADTSKTVDYEAEIIQRMEAMVAGKRAENESAIARITALDSGWQDVHVDLDKDLKGELETVKTEAQAIEQARERLKKNTCSGVDRDTYAIAGKVIDTESKTGLPGLLVKIEGPDDENITGDTLNVTLVDTREPALFEATTDNYGNFSFAFPIGQSRTGESRKFQLTFVVLIDPDTIVHREEVSVKPVAGSTEHVVIAVKCTGRLKETLAFGRQVADSVEGDAALVEERAANVGLAYDAFGSLSETTLLQLRRLKEELSVNPPLCGPNGEPRRAASESDPNAATDFLGNSNSRELHDLSNQKPGCRIDQISFDHRINFKTEKEALAAGYDYCAYCYGKDKSKR